jgi:hypothetical protein
MNNCPSKYINIHQRLLIALKIRKNYAYILRIYTIDVFLIYYIIHQLTSPSIMVPLRLIPMTAPTALIEPSFAELIAAIEQTAELSEQRRRHWLCSLRQIAKWLDRPAAVIPARWNSVRISVVQLHHARVGVTAKTLANHKSNVRAALRWFGKEQGVPQGYRRSGPASVTCWTAVYGTGSIA